jgi:hypothetical protein
LTVSPVRTHIPIIAGMRAAKLASFSAQHQIHVGMFNVNLELDEKPWHGILHASAPSCV